MYAYILYHFGDNIKYLNYEILFLHNLRDNTDYDIIYAYSAYDTPQSFIDKIKSLNINIKFYKYYDDGITVNISKKYNSIYKHFNILRTSNYLFTYLLHDYKKICTVESDMYIMKNMDDIFKLHTPCVHYSSYIKKKVLMDKNYKSNEKLLSDKDDVLKRCNIGSWINGGVMLIKPSLRMYNLCIDTLKDVIEKNCAYPGEALFLATNPIYYNLPVKYNFSIYFVDVGYHRINDVKLIHYDSKEYKLYDEIKNKYYKYTNKKSNTYKILMKYKKNVYDKYINHVLSEK